MYKNDKHNISSVSETNADVLHIFNLIYQHRYTITTNPFGGWAYYLRILPHIHQAPYQQNFTHIICAKLDTCTKHRHHTPPPTYSHLQQLAPQSLYHYSAKCIPLFLQRSTFIAGVHLYTLSQTETVT